MCAIDNFTLRIWDILSFLGTHGLAYRQWFLIFFATAGIHAATSWTLLSKRFGPKLDVSINSESYGRIKKVSFDPYNESGRTVRVI